MTNPTSTRLSTAAAFLKSYSALTPEALLAHLDQDFTIDVLPTSLNFPALDRAGFQSHAGRITAIFSRFAMIPQLMFEDPTKNTVVVYAKMEAESVKLDLGESGRWENECVIFLTMSEDGEKIVQMREFVDSARARLLQEKIWARGEGGMFRD